MKALIAAVAEHAWVENGCLSICRTFDYITAEKFPYQLPRISVGLRLLIGKAEAGEHKLNISLVDFDGKKIMATEVNIRFQPPQESVSESTFSFALNGQSIVFPQPGDYVVNVIIDGKIETSIPLYVRKK